LGVEFDIDAERAESVTDGKVRTLMDWLQEQTNRGILIHKQEDGDTDRVRIRLDEVGYRPDDRSIDGYTEGPALVLHGRGVIATDRAEAPLPQDRYVIPLAGFAVTRAQGGGINVRTDRATYRISPDAAARM